MNDLLIHLLETKRDCIGDEWKTRVLKNWNSRLLADSFATTRRTSKLPSGETGGVVRAEELIHELVDLFYSQLLEILRNENSKVNSRHANESVFPRYAPQGMALTLDFVLGIFCCGEEVVEEFLARNHDRKYRFEVSQIAWFYEVLNGAFHLLMESYAEAFCTRCVDPLKKSTERIHQLCLQYEKERYEQKSF
jgi:hypothetical protein